MPDSLKNREGLSSNIGKAIVILFWMILAGFVFINRKKLTIHAIVNYAPGNIFAAAALILALFTAKGFVMVLNCDILYAANAVMFSTPLAFAVNILGSVIMLTIPYVIGRRGGDKIIDKLIEKYSKLSVLKDAPKNHDFLLCFLLRVVGFIPCEPVGAYLGACSVQYGRFLLGSLLGLAPGMILFSVIGEYADDPTSPQFITAASVQAFIILCSLAASVITTLKTKKK